MSLSFQNMCRTCMLNQAEQQVMFDKSNAKNNITQMLSMYAVSANTYSMAEKEICLKEMMKTAVPQLKIQRNDKLPKVVCLECSDKIKEIYRFQQSCLTVQQTLNKMLENEDAYDDNQGDVGISKTKFYDIVDFDDDSIEEAIKIEIAANEEFNESDLSDIDWDANVCSDWEKELTSRNQSPRKISQKKAEASFENTIEPSSSKNENCNSKRKAAKNLETHMPPQNENGSVSCQECDTVLETIALWQEHMRQHRLRKLPKRKYVKKSIKPKKYYSCEYCAKEFSRDAAYRNHLRTHTGEEPYLCIECGKSFNVVSSLNTHMLRHKGEKNIQCPHCPKKFVCSSGLYGHMMVHTKEKRFVCTICGSAFHMAYQLRKHNLYHNNIRNYQCEYCDMRFFTGDKQRRHMLTHTGEKPYRCKYCERAFTQSNECIKHLRQHLGDNVYQCELCPLRFPLARDLRVHFAGHKDDDEETRTRNLEARAEEERNLQIKLGVQDV